MAVVKFNKNLDIGQVAYMFEINQGSVCRWQNPELTKNPLPVARYGGGNTPSEYDIRATFLWGLSRFGNMGDTLDPAAEKAKNLAVDTQIKKIKEQQLRGELGPLNMMSQALALLGTKVSAILDTIPAKLRQSLPELGAREIEIVRNEIAKARNACAELQLDIGSIVSGNMESDDSEGT